MFSLRPSLIILKVVTDDNFPAEDEGLGEDMGGAEGGEEGAVGGGVSLGWSQPQPHPGLPSVPDDDGLPSVSSSSPTPPPPAPRSYIPPQVRARQIFTYRQKITVCSEHQTYFTHESECLPCLVWEMPLNPFSLTYHIPQEHPSAPVPTAAPAQPPPAASFHLPEATGKFMA